MSRAEAVRDFSETNPADLTGAELAQLEREVAANTGHNTVREAMENVRAGRPPKTHTAVAVVRETFEMGEKTVSQGSYLAGRVVGRSAYFAGAADYEAEASTFAGDVPFVAVATESGVEPQPAVRGGLIGRSDLVVIVPHITVVNTASEASHE